MKFYCKINDGQESGWQGPYENLSPRAAASQWIKQEWDCRHGEVVAVQVRDEAGAVQTVNLRVRVNVIVERNCEALREAA